MLRELLFERTKTVVLTSATLAAGGEFWGPRYAVRGVPRRQRVITSYSIHYTKLYDAGVHMAQPFQPEVILESTEHHEIGDKIEHTPP